MSWLKGEIEKRYTGANGLDLGNIAKDLGVAGALYSLINPNDSSGIAKFLGTGGQQAPVGYTGGIPNYTATRELVPNAFASTYTTPTGEVAPRRPGMAGRRYFTDTQFTQSTDEPFMGITAEQIAAQNLAAQNELALFENILGGVETQRMAGGTGEDYTEGLATDASTQAAVNEALAGTGTATTGTTGTAGTTAFGTLTGDAQSPYGWNADQIFSYFNQGLTPSDIVGRVEGFGAVQPGTMAYDSLVGDYEYWQQNRAGTTTTDSTYTNFVNQFAGRGLTVEDAAALAGSGYSLNQLATSFGVDPTELRTFVNYYTDGSTTTDDGKVGTTGMGNLMVSLGGTRNADGTITAVTGGTYSIQDGAWRPVAATTTTDTTGTGTTGTGTDRQLTEAELKQAVLNGTMDYNTAYGLLGIADAANPFGFTEDEKLTLGISESQRTGQGYKQNPTSGAMALYDYDTNTFVDDIVNTLTLNAADGNTSTIDLTGGTTSLTTTGTADPAAGPLAPTFDMVDASDGFSEQEQGIIYSVMTTSGANIADVAEEFGTTQDEVITGLLRGGYQTPAEIAATLNAVDPDIEFTEEDLIANLLETNKTTPEEVAAYYGIPVAAVTARYRELGGSKFAQGGNVNGYYLGGPTDGMADQIPATINNMQPAALSDGEFVIPADVVSHLGNGNSDSGAKNLYSMMDRIRQDRTGTTKQGRQIDPNKYLA